MCNCGIKAAVEGGALTHVKVEVPARRPLDVRRLPLDVVRKEDFEWSSFPVNGLWRQIRSNGNGEQIQLRQIRIEIALVLVLYGERLNLLRMHGGITHSQGREDYDRCAQRWSTLE